MRQDNNIIQEQNPVKNERKQNNNKPTMKRKQDRRLTNNAKKTIKYDLR